MDQERSQEDEREAPPACPTCDGAAIPIVYGYPSSFSENVHQGGCIVYPGAPRWWCPSCEQSIETDEDRAAFVAGVAAIYMTGDAPVPSRRNFFARLRRRRHPTRR